MRSSKMLAIAFAVIASFIAHSSAQPTSQSSTECNTTYNAAFENANSTLTNCSVAYNALASGSPITAEQRMMVCDAGEQCNAMIENVISACNNTVSSV